VASIVGIGRRGSTVSDGLGREPCASGRKGFDEVRMTVLTAVVTTRKGQLYFRNRVQISAPPPFDLVLVNDLRLVLLILDPAVKEIKDEHSECRVTKWP